MPIFPTQQPDDLIIAPDPELGIDGGTIEDVAKELQEEINANKRTHPENIADFIEALDTNLE